MNESPASGLVTSYLTLRKFIGILGIALPIVLMLGGWLVFHTGLRPSLSNYYHTGMRDVFVGTLWAIGVFLVSYRGFDRRDDIAGNVACVFAIATAIFPEATDGATHAARIVGYVHFSSAAALFLTLCYFSLRLFTLTNPDATPTRGKIRRNRVYVVCGWLMLGCVVGIAAFKLLVSSEWVTSHRLVFWLETIAVTSFGVSWLTKGEAFFRDEKTGDPGELIATGTVGN